MGFVWWWMSGADGGIVVNDLKSICEKCFMLQVLCINDYPLNFRHQFSLYSSILIADMDKNCFQTLRKALHQMRIIVQ